MKGIILAGGTGSRLYPITQVTNKHILPVFDQPMIFYPLNTLIKAGIKEIIIVSNSEHALLFSKLLAEDPQYKNINLQFVSQKESGGSAQALGLCQTLTTGHKVVVILGDNVMFEDISSAVADFEQTGGAMIFLKKVIDPQKYTVAILAGEDICGLQDKPVAPQSDYAVTGLYFFDDLVWPIISSLQPAVRGELDINEINNYYLKNKKLSYRILEQEWFDIDTYNDLWQANFWQAKQKKII